MANIALIISGIMFKSRIEPAEYGRCGIRVDKYSVKYNYTYAIIRKSLRHKLWLGAFPHMTTLKDLIKKIHEQYMHSAVLINKNKLKY